MTTVASGRCTSAPTPVLNAIGTNPKLATNVVISTGRRRVVAACVTASSSARPFSRSWRMVETRIISSSTATPDIAMKPMAAEIENGMSRSHSATMPPTAAIGVLNRNTNVIPGVVRFRSPAQAAAYFMLGETMGTAASGADAGKAKRSPFTNPFFPLRNEQMANRWLEERRARGLPTTIG